MKTVLITGASRGIGLEFTKQYLAQGDRVIATCRAPDWAAPLHDLKQTPHGTHLSILPLDVCDEESRQQLVESLAGQPIHLLINNAGQYGPHQQRLGNIDEQEWLKVLHVDCIAPFKVVEALRANLAEPESSVVAILSSRMGSVADNDSGGDYIYRSAKAALNAVAKSLAIDLAEEGIGVVVLHPGWVKTDMGGPGALIDVTSSVSGMRRVIAGITRENSGSFIAYDGTVVPW